MLGKQKTVLITAVYSLMRMLPIKKNRVLLFSYYGEQYSGSPKYIGNYLSKESDLELIWAFVQKEKHREFVGKAVRYGHLKYYYYLATAGTIITNYRMTAEFQKRPGQVYIQTWHSSLRLKMIEKDAENTLPVHYIEMAKRDSRQIDYLLAGSRKSREIFEQSFWYHGEIVNTGTPQCDILFADRSFYIDKVCQHYHIPKGSKIALYAPTFRKRKNTEVYDLDTTALSDALKQKYGGEWYLLMRLHPHLIGKTDCFQYSDVVLQATDYDDVQELLCAADVLISDYSAIMFDYAVTRRPCFLYTPDLEDYTTNDRKLYFQMEELPFRSFVRQSELFEYIRTYSVEEYKKSVEQFLDAIGSFDDGQASERIYKMIQEAGK